jgi:hypothetical protein
VESDDLELSSCCKNLAAIGHLYHTPPSQGLLLDREENDFSCKIFEHDQEMFLKIG